MKYLGHQQQTMLSRGHERWPKRIKHDPNPRNARNGSSIAGHKGYYGADGEPLISMKDGQPARNKRDVWWMNTGGYKGAHFATFPQELPETCIRAGTKEGDIVLDPFAGSGTTGEVALKLGRKFIGIELNASYVKKLIEPRLQDVDPLFHQPVD